MRVHSLTILHYGKDYLSYALRSVYESVDQLHIFYTPTPSHGHTTNIPPVETREDLMKAAFAYDPDNKVRWYDMGGVMHEGQQRDGALRAVQEAGAELVLVVDCDEIWPCFGAGSIASYFEKNNKARNNLVNMFHFWRSFNWVCKDDGWPVRVIDLRFKDGTEYIQRSLLQIFHFGYAVTNRVIDYKWQIHGHKNELRPGWLDNIWSHWPPVYPDADNNIKYPGDIPFCCHPTNDKNFWEPEPFDKSQLPEFMRKHPFYGLERIE